MARFFGYKTIASEAGISQADLDALCGQAKADYPDDEMMQELRLLRTCLAIKAGRCTVHQAKQRDADRLAEIPALGAKADHH